MLNFKEWFQSAEENSFSDPEVATMYFHNHGMKVREIATKTNKSIGEVYRIIQKYGSPNRQISNHENVMSFAGAGFNVNKIAEFTGYTPRNIRYILKRRSQ